MKAVEHAINRLESQRGLNRVAPEKFPSGFSKIAYLR
jgi:hypothetical protein